MVANHGNVLSATSITELMASSLPKGSNAELRNPYDVIALLCHACMLAVGFRLIGLGEDHKIGELLSMLENNRLSNAFQKPPRKLRIPSHCPMNGMQQLPLTMLFDMLILNHHWNILSRSTA